MQLYIISGEGRKYIAFYRSHVLYMTENTNYIYMANILVLMCVSGDIYLIICNDTLMLQVRCEKIECKLVNKSVL